MTTNTLVKKLRIQPGQQLLVLNAPQGYLKSLGDLPDGATLAEEPAGQYEFVQCFAKDKAQLERLAPAALDAVLYDGLLWICYPKKSGQIASDLSRDIVWKSMLEIGVRPVTQIAIDETWSALRFRPPERVGN